MTSVASAVPILMYHEVTPRPHHAFRKYSVTPRELARQLGWLARTGYTAVDMDAVCAAWRGTRALPRHPVVITFDDGMRDCVQHAAPVLIEHGFTATFYVVAGLVGGTSRWLLHERGVEFPMADWAMLRRVEAAGMRCEAHSMSHPRLAELEPAACREELARSRDILENQMGRPVRHLAYPFGSFSIPARDIAGEVGYDTACTVNEAVATPRDDLLALPRIPVVGGEGMLDFVSRLHTGHPVGRLFQATATGVRRRLGIGALRMESSS